MSVRRIAQVIGVKPDDIEEYERIHADVWPTVLATIKKANIQNYSIFRYEHLLFAYMGIHRYRLRKGYGNHCRLP